MTNLRIVPLTFIALIGAAAFSAAQQPRTYTAPRTEHGRPDLQGVWVAAFLTMLERPPGVDSLVVDEQQANAIVTTIRSRMPVVNDPDVNNYDLKQLTKVKGEYRTSMIVEPKDGKIPYTAAGLELVASIAARNGQKFDDPEQRPLAERCLENLGYAPMRTVPVMLPRQIVQTRDDVVIMSEDAVGLRVIHLTGTAPPETVRTIEGYSAGHWEGDTLVVRTDHLRADDPARTNPGRPILLSRQSRITERFTRVSPTELFYQFTVEDPSLYTQPWSAEFSMTRHDGVTYEYACHEGNYALPNGLRANQAVAAEKAAQQK